MAEHEQDKDVSRRYRELGAEAVIMLAVAVTSQLEREQPEVTAMSGAEEEVKTEQAKNEAVPETRARRDAPASAPAKPASPPRQFAPEPDLQAGIRAKKQAEGAAAPTQPQVKDELARRQLETPRAEERQRDQAAASVPEAANETKLRKAEPSTQQAPATRAPSPAENAVGLPALS